MVSMMSDFGIVILSNIINNPNFLIIYIILLVVFFLLGLFLGISTGTRKRTPTENIAVPPVDDVKKKVKHSDPAGQSVGDRTDVQTNRSIPQTTHSRHKHHSHRTGYY